MTKAGLAKIEEAKSIGEWFKTASPRKDIAMPPELKEALAKNKKASDNFNKLAKTYRRHFIGWISSAKRTETRKRRVAESIRLLERNEKLGMK